MTEKNESNLDIMRHSVSHVMAAAVKSLFKDVKFAIGPIIDEGFYYDFDLGKQTLSAEDLPKIEAKMQEIIKANLKIEREELSIKEALSRVKGQLYKEELIKDLQKEGEKKVSFYTIGDVFDDLCRGPHVKSTKEISVFKLLRVSGAYWRGDEKNKMLQRIYGTAFETQKELDEYLKMLEEAEKRDHRKIGKEQDLFSFHEIAPGMPFFHPKGTIIYNELKNFWIKAQEEFDYDMVLCPSMLDVSVWKKSGHWDHYKDDMYFIKETEEGKQFALRPMDCPGAIAIYNNSLKSYRDLPLRFAEPGLITRNEKSGQLNGLFRVQQFVQDDAHIFITEDQIESEVKNVIKLVNKIYEPFGLGYKPFLSTRPDDFMGEIKVWDKAEKELKKILEEVYGEGNYGLKEKDGAFYGPKIDFQLKDSIGRTWQCATIQLDFQMPLQFDCKYIDKDGKEKAPVLIHRTIMGSFERFMGILVEHYAGVFPTWLAPVQVKILPVSDKFLEYAHDVKNKLKAEKIRVELDDSAESLGKKIRAGEQEKVPYLLIIGEKEVTAKQVAVRQRGKGDLGPQDLDNFIDSIKGEILNRK